MLSPTVLIPFTTTGRTGNDLFYSVSVLHWQLDFLTGVPPAGRTMTLRISLFVSTRPERLLDPSIGLDEGYDCLPSGFPLRIKTLWPYGMSQSRHVWIRAVQR